MVMNGLKYIGIGLLAIMLVAVIGILITQRVSDGPIEFLQGGSFRTGELITQPVTDWSFGVDKRSEFELVGYATSRTAGYIMHDGVAYMTCDLGYIWNRLEGPQRWILHLIYLFKHWHEDALQDGRARIRIDGKIYPTTFVKVEDPALEAILRARLEDQAREYLAPAELGPPPAQGPADIWFFRMAPSG
jgi:hypothetical protein